MRRQLQLRPHTGGEPLLPLLDVSLSLMFAFLMLINRDAQQMTELPTVETADPTKSSSHQGTDKRPVVRIDQDGSVTLNGQTTTDESLVESMNRIAAAAIGKGEAPSKTSIRLEGHKQVGYGRLVTIRETLRSAGFPVIEIAEVKP